MSQSSAKFLLCGEYSVFWGAPAIAGPIPSLQIEIKTSQNLKHQLNKKDLLPAENLVLEKILHIISPEFANTLDIQSNIPISMGLGSSAALCSALCRLLNPLHSEQQQLTIAQEAENFIHGKSSGLDVHACFYQRPLIFSKDPASHKNNFDFLNDELFKKLPLYLISSQLQHQTKANLSNSYQDLYNNKNELINSCQLTKVALLNQDLKKLGEQMTYSQNIFRKAKLSHPKLEGIIDKINNSSELKSSFEGAKITGSGCGGFLLCLFKKSVYKELKNHFKSEDIIPVGLDSIDLTKQ